MLEINTFERPIKFSGDKRITRECYFLAMEEAEQKKKSSKYAGNRLNE